jgi:16S rRNA (cytosine967-C5)-methyltransferase
MKKKAAPGSPALPLQAQPPQSEPLPGKDSPAQVSPAKVASTQVSAARKAAFQILLAVERGHSHSDDLLRSKAVNALSAPDRHLATALVLGVLRWQIQLDHATSALLTRPNAKLDPEIRIALRIGAFQILHMDRIPARAAIDESVGLAKQAGHRFASGMVNAVLRKLAASHVAEPLDTEGGGGFNPRNDPAKSMRTSQPAEELTGFEVLKGHDFSRADNAGKMIGALAPEVRSSHDSPVDLALTYAHPAWLVERWITFYGVEAALAICAHGQRQPVTTIRLVHPAVEAELLQAGIKLEPGSLLTSARIVVSGDITASPAFLEGRIRLQDEGSQLVAELTAPALDRNVKNILDACAAPGGKTLILAERNPEARIVACEQSESRFEALCIRLAPFADRIECRLADATTLPAYTPTPKDGPAFDLALALVDAPCSGTGTLGRNPEIRHRLRSQDLPRQAERQRAILSAVLSAVHPGGSVVYATCSLEPEENEQVVAAVLAAAPHTRTVSLDARIIALHDQNILTTVAAEKLRASLTPDGALRLLPGTFQTDGFFIALIERCQ